MKISSNSYDYYNQIYQSNYASTVADTNSNTADENTNNVDAVSSATRRRPMPNDIGVPMDLESNGRMMFNFMKMQGDSSSVGSEQIEKLKTDMDSLKTADIDSMSADEVKSTLTNITTDMQAMHKSQDASSISIDNMSESDMRTMLKDVQEHAKNAPSQNQGAKMSEAFSKVKSDMDSIKTADIDSMSADDVKTTLTNLTTDMKAIQSPYGKSGSALQIDVNSMSESDMRTMLKKIQEHANKMSSMAQNQQSTEASTKIDEDISSIEKADIDSMSGDDMKTLLTNLKNDVQASVQVQNGQTNDGSEIDLDNLSESEMKEILKKIQEQINNMPVMNGSDAYQTADDTSTEINSSSEV